LPGVLRPICHQMQGHRSDANAAYFDPFVEWVRALAPMPGQYGWPDFIVEWTNRGGCGGCEPRQLDGKQDVGC
jgi:hypothetical protein